MAKIVKPPCIKAVDYKKKTVTLEMPDLKGMKHVKWCLLKVISKDKATGKNKKLYKKLVRGGNRSCPFDGSDYTTDLLPPPAADRVLAFEIEVAIARGGSSEDLDMPLPKGP